MFILNRTGIITRNVLIVLIVPGNLLVLHVAAGPTQSGVLQKIEELTQPERKLCLPERSLRIHKFPQKRGKRNMGALPHMVVLAGVRPILVATPWVLVPKGVQIHRTTVTGHPTTDPPTGHAWSPGICPMDKKTYLADRACPVTGHQPPGIHQPPGKRAI